MKEISVNVYTRKRINKDGNAIWSYYFFCLPVNGKRKQISKSGYKTKTAARKAGNEAVKDYLSNGFTSNIDKMISVSDFIEYVWFPGKIASKNWQKTTVSGYRKRIKNNIIPYIGHLPISGVSCLTLQNMINDLYFDKKRSNNTVSDIHGMLSNIFNYALNLNYIDRSPMPLVDLPKEDFDPEDFDYDRNYQVRDIISEESLDAIFERFPEGATCFIPMVCALYASMRLGEAFGLAWEDIDFEKNAIYIRRQMCKLEGGGYYISNPKYNSKRVIPMCSTLRNILMKEKEKQSDYDIINHYYLKKRPHDEFRNTHGIYDITEENGIDRQEIHFVNIYPDGSYVKTNITQHASRIIHGYSSYLWSPKKREKGTPICENFNFHSLRHTFCSRLFILGVNPTYIAVLMGHRNSEMIGRTTAKYMHIPFETLNELTDKIEAIYTMKQ